MQRQQQKKVSNNNIANPGDIMQSIAVGSVEKAEGE